MSAGDELGPLGAQPSRGSRDSWVDLFPDPGDYSRFLRLTQDAPGAGLTARLRFLLDLAEEVERL